VVEFFAVHRSWLTVHNTYMRINYRERVRRMRALNRWAWSSSESLREGYHERPRMPIELVVCPLGKEVNHGGILRLAEAFMLERVTFSKESDGAEDFSGHRGADQWQPWVWANEFEAVSLAKAAGRQCVALTLNERAVAFDTFDYTWPCTLVVGSEMMGLPGQLADQCDGIVAIPMFGVMASLNVATATGIVVQHMARCYADEMGFQPLREESARLLNPDGKLSF
jgi:tRNA (guanosine-2'-O-)-methyltransferase